MRKQIPLLNLLLSLVTIVLCFFFMEVAYRFGIFGWSSFSYQKMNSIHDMGLTGFMQRAAHPELVFELKPNLDTYFKLVPFRTNGVGMRDREYSRARPPEAVRVAVIGDSLTMGSGVLIEDTYSKVLERRFQESDPDRRYEFMNFGTAGYNLRQYYGVITLKAREYDPEMILIGFCAGNDQDMLREDRYHTPFIPKPRQDPFFQSLLWTTFRKVWRSYARRLRGRSPVRAMRTEVSESPEQGPDVVRTYLADYFSRIGDFSTDNGIPVVVAYLWHSPRDRPILEKMVADGQPIIREMATGNGLHFVDASFEPERRSDVRIYALDNHPNARAHRVFADRIYDHLIATRLLQAPQEQAGDEE